MARITQTITDDYSQTETLLSLVKAAAPYNKVVAFLQKLSHEAIAEQIQMSDPQTGKTPLHYAAACGNLEIVRLLLRYDADATQKDKTGLSPIDTVPANAPLVQALLATRGEWQAKEIDFSINRTTALIEEAVKHMQPIQKSPAPGVLFIGKTGSGKSTLVNYLMGIEYQTAYSEDGSIYVVPTQGKEFTATSHGFISQTLYPIICHNTATQSQLVDMPGFNDTRGKPEEICAGVSTLLLAERFKAIKAIVLVCRDSDLYDPKLDGIRETFEKAGRMLLANPKAATQPISLVITAPDPKRYQQGYGAILKRLQNWKETEFATAVEPKQHAIKLILDNLLTQKNILAIDVCDSRGRKQFYTLLANLPSIPVKEFDFKHYHTEVERFQKFLHHLQSIKNKGKEKIQALLSVMSDKILQETAAKVTTIAPLNKASTEQLSKHAKIKFNTEFNTLAELEKQADTVNQTLQQLYAEIKQTLSPHCLSDNHKIIWAGKGDADTLEKELKRRQNEQTVNADLFAKLDSISALLAGAQSKPVNPKPAKVTVLSDFFFSNDLASVGQTRKDAENKPGDIPGLK